MSFDFSNNINSISKAQAAYKDGGGMGGGGMYFRQRKKGKNEDEDDIFERSSDDKDPNEIKFDSDIKEDDIPRESIVNKFVNWFRINNTK